MAVYDDAETEIIEGIIKRRWVIFVSIDENEVHHLRMLMDEVFGEENFLAQLGWQKVYSPKNQSTYFSNDYEFILSYAKNIMVAQINLLHRTEEMNARYINPDNDPRGPWQSGDLVASEERVEGHYKIKSPISGKEFDAPQGKHWAYSQENMLKLIEDNRIWFGKDGKNFPRIKQFLSEVKQGRKASTLLLYKEFGHTDEAKKEIKTIFSEHEEAVFSTPKPTRLIMNLLTLGTGKDSIILDSFSGSGATAHAVLNLNREDGGNRRFILVECEDYADRITAERVRRVIKGVPSAKDEKLKEGLGSTFSYFELGDPIEMESILEGDKLPGYLELARYVFYTATGEEFDPGKVDEERNFIGESRDYEVYLFYKPDIEYLRTTALTLEKAKNLGEYKNKKRLVFAPSKYLDHDYLLEYCIDYCQLPFEIYKIKG